MSAGEESAARDIVVDDTGVPYVVGGADDSSGVTHWVVRMLGCSSE